MKPINDNNPSLVSMEDASRHAAKQRSNEAFYKQLADDALSRIDDIFPDCQQQEAPKRHYSVGAYKGVLDKYLDEIVNSLASKELTNLQIIEKYSVTRSTFYYWMNKRNVRELVLKARKELSS
jgi:hypothetical protein